jgi:membrane protease YdiL (CAAX protease family)
MQEIAVASSPADRPLTSRYCWISLVEICARHILRRWPQRVPHCAERSADPLRVLVSFRLRDDGWSVARLTRPKSWWKTVLMAFVAAAVLRLGSELVIQPLASHLWRRSEQVSSSLKTPALDWKLALRNLAIVWVFAGFGEEIGYRGYLLTRAADPGNRSKLAYVAAMLYVAVLFGLGHVYKGPVGIIDSTYSGLLR